MAATQSASTSLVTPIGPSDLADRLAGALLSISPPYMTARRHAPSACRAEAPSGVVENAPVNFIGRERRASTDVPQALLVYGDVDVSWQTVAFKKIKFLTRENIGLGPVDIPAQMLSTTALWLSPDDEIRRQLKQARLRASEALCGVRNLAVVALPMVAMCDSRDVGGVVDSQNLGRSTMIVYDRYPGGLGYCEQGFRRVGDLLSICLAMVRECPCDDGCPSCVGLPNLRPAIHSDPDLTRGYPVPNKAATLRLLELLCQPCEDREASIEAASTA